MSVKKIKTATQLSNAFLTFVSPENQLLIVLATALLIVALDSTALLLKASVFKYPTLVRFVTGTDSATLEVTVSTLMVTSPLFVYDITVFQMGFGSTPKTL